MKWFQDNLVFIAVFSCLAIGVLLIVSNAKGKPDTPPREPRNFQEFEQMQRNATQAQTEQVRTVRPSRKSSIISDEASIGGSMLIAFLGIAAFLVFYGFMCHSIAISAHNKGHDYIAYLLLSVFISPLATFIVVRLLPEKSLKMPCPECGENVAFEARSCRFCDCIITKNDRTIARKARKLSR